MSTGRESRSLRYGGRDAVLQGIYVGLAEADPRRAVSRGLRVSRGRLTADGVSLRLQDSRRIFLLGAGKAALGMGSQVLLELDGWVKKGVVIVPGPLRSGVESGLEVMWGTHPLPTERNLKATRRLLDSVGKARRTDLVVIVISGGASALLTLPAPGVSLESERGVTELLIRSGATIQEINTVRKHISSIKGGGLCGRLYPARVLALILSDVIGNDLASVASGPTVPDTTSFSDARAVLERRGLWSAVPEEVRRRIDEGVRGLVPETPKPGSKYFDRTDNVLIGSNLEPCLAVKQKMEELGYSTFLLTTRMVGEAREVGRVLGRMVASEARSGRGKRAVAFVAGGETTVVVKGDGMGGRNQELTLSAAIEIAGAEGAVVSSVGTDGVDGPTDAAGAVADWTTAVRGEEMGLDAGEFLERNDSYSYFDKVGGLVNTGPTGTNVNDIFVGTAGVPRRVGPVTKAFRR